MKRSKNTRAKDGRDLSAFISDRGELTRRMFRALKPSEIKAMAPTCAKKLPLEDLQALCLEELINMSNKSLRTILCTPAQDNTITLDSDSDTDQSSESSDTEASDSESEESGSTEDSDVSDEVMVVEDSDEDVKIEIDSKCVKISTNGAKKDLNANVDKENETNRIVHVSSNHNNRNDVVKDQYADKINKLDILTAKLSQEIEKLSKKKETTSKDLTNEHVNEMLSELTKIHSEISTEQQQNRRKDSTDTDVTVESVSNIDTKTTIQGNQRNPKGKGVIDQSNSKLSKIGKHNSKKRKENSAQQSEEVIIVHNEGAQENTDRNSNKVTKKQQKDIPFNSSSTVSKLTDKRKDKRSESTEKSKEETVYLLSDSSEDSQEKLEDELQKSITESRKNKIQDKETQKNHTQKFERTIDKRKKPFSEDDIEIEIVVDGGAHQNYPDKAVTAKKSMNHRETSKNKGANINKNDSNCASETIVNDMLKQIDSTETKVAKDSSDPITILSSDSEEPEEGEVDSSSDGSDAPKEAPKKRLKKAGLVRIKSKKVTSNADLHENINKDGELCIETPGASIDRSEGLLDISENETRIQMKGAIVKVTENEKLNETILNKVKSVAVKVAQSNDTIIIKVGDSNITSRVVSNENSSKPRDVDNITVVVKNAADKDETNRIVKMTEDVRSLESIVVAVRNNDNDAKFGSNRQEAFYKDLRPVQRKFVAKASDFLFIKPKDHGKPLLIARDTNTQETADVTNTDHNNDTNQPPDLDIDHDMDILDSEYTDIVLLEDAVCTTELPDTVEKDNRVTDAEPIANIPEKDTLEPHLHYIKSAELDTDDTPIAINEIITGNVEKDTRSLDVMKLPTDVAEYLSSEVETHCDKPELAKAIGDVSNIKLNFESSKEQDMTRKDLVTENNAATFEQLSNLSDNSGTVMQAYEEPVTIVEKKHELFDLPNNLKLTIDDKMESNSTFEALSNMQCANESNETIDKMADANENEENEVVTLKNNLGPNNCIPEMAKNNIESQNIFITNEDNVTQLRTASEVDTNINTNEELTTNDTQTDATLIAETNSTTSNNQGFEPNKLETVLGPVNATSVLADKEKSELEATNEQKALHQANPLEDGEIDAVDELAMNDGLVSDAAEDGELTDPSSSDVESVEIPNEIISISDEDMGQDTAGTESTTRKGKSKKKKKDKKHKKCKGKCKNRKRLETKEEKIEWVVKESVINEVNDVKDLESNTDTMEVTEIDDKIIEETLEKEELKYIVARKEDINDISSDSSKIEITEDVNSNTNTKDSSQKVIDMLSIEISSDESSDEPVFEDIDVITAAIDGIEKQQLEEQTSDENISWRDRYLDSKKVKQVLTTSNIFNALRKKNKELKKKLLESKQQEEVREKTPDPPPVEEVLQTNIEEGSIEHYNTLQGSTKFADPVADLTEAKEETKNNTEDITTEETNTEAGREQTVIQTNLTGPEGVTKEMKKDAKNLLKMYKKLLKYNDMTRATDPSKKAKKKKRKKDVTG